MLKAHHQPIHLLRLVSSLARKVFLEETKEYLAVLFILGVAGLVMWLDKEAAPPLLWQWSVTLHDLAMVELTGMTTVHIVLAAIQPATEASILTKLTGWFPEEHVVSHHAKWYGQSAPS